MYSEVQMQQRESGVKSLSEQLFKVYILHYLAGLAS